MPQPGDVLLASYRTGGVVFAIVVVAPQNVQVPNVQVLCSGAGAGTSSPSLRCLWAACTIPANTLAIGDRVEVRFSFSHQGTTSGFNFQVNWGQTAMVQRTASARRRDRDRAWRRNHRIRPGPRLDMQTWGTALPLDSGGGVSIRRDQFARSYVDFQAALSAAGTDTVSLQNYTVLRYPAQ